MRVVLELGEDEYEIFLQREGETVKIDVDGHQFEAKLGQGGVVTLGDETHHVEVTGERTLTIGGHELPFRIIDFATGAAAGEKGGARGARIKPPMPGKIVSIAVKEGDEVQAGDVLLILEAMKMQNEITAPGPGTVKKIHTQPGQNVEAKDVMIELE